MENVNWHNSGVDLGPDFKYPIETFLNKARSFGSSVKQVDLENSVSEGNLAHSILSCETQKTSVS